MEEYCFRCSVGKLSSHRNPEKEVIVDCKVMNTKVCPIVHKEESFDRWISRLRDEK